MLFVKEQLQNLNRRPIQPHTRHTHAYAQGMDGYSNVLYVKEQFAKLSHLAHHAAATDRYCSLLMYCLCSRGPSLIAARRMAGVAGTIVC